MATYNDDSKTYSSSAVGTAGLSLGIIGTTLASGILNNGVGGLFGGNASSLQQQNQALAMQNAILTSEKESSKVINDGLVAVYTELRKQDKLQDEKTAALSSRVLALETSAPLREQIVMGQVQSVANSVSNLASSTASQIANAQAQGAAAVASATSGLQYQITCLQNTLNGIVKTVVPNTSVCPGWGSVSITPATTTTTTA